MKKLLIWLLLLLLMLLPCFSAQAATPYRTFSLGTDGDLVETQTAYEPVRTMTRFGEETLNNPGDLRMGPDGNLYIADTGNKRIVVVTKTGNLVKIIGDRKTLNRPTGVYVDDNLNVFVADEREEAIFVFDKNGEMIRTYEKPTHQLYGNSRFRPNKVVLDKRGNLYVISTGNTNGIVQISPVGDGEFLGYYGANSSNISLLTRFRRLLFGANSDAVGTIVATSSYNLCIDEKNMVYTVNQTGDDTSLRRLNVAGKDTMTPDYITIMNSAVAVNASGSVFTANANGRIMEYTSEGAMLFLFGTPDNGEQRVGTFQSVTGLVADDDYTLYVLDERLGSVQVLRPTEFANMVHEAFTLFQEGKYAESKEPWTEVLRMNSLFTYASTGLGEALYREGNYPEAMEAFRNGGYRQGYSDAYWEQRSNWLHTSLAGIMIAVVALIVVWQVVKYFDRRKHILSPIRKAGKWVGNIPIVSQVGYCFYMLKNPFDTCYGIKKEKKAGYISALIVLCIFFVLYVVNKYFAGFLFKTMPDGYYELFNDFLMVFGVFLLLTICCYLVCTITDGEAKFKDIFIGASYALVPMLIFLPIKLILSNVLTFNEQFFITLIDFVSYGWTAVLIILMIMYLNDYSLGKTVKTIIITLFTVLVVVALGVVLYMLISQLIDFIASIYGEVVYRFVKKV